MCSSESVGIRRGLDAHVVVLQCRCECLYMYNWDNIMCANVHKFLAINS